MKLKIVFGCLLLVAIAGVYLYALSSTTQTQQVADTMFSNNITFSGSIKDEAGNPLDDVTVLVREFQPKGFEGQYRDTEQIVSSDYSIHVEGAAIATLKFSKEDYFSESIQFNIMKGLPTNIQSATDRWLWENDIVLREVPSELPEIVVAGLDELHFEPDKQSYRIVKLANQWDLTPSKFVIGKWLNSDDKLAAIEMPYIMLTYVEDSTVVGKTLERYDGTTAYCAPSGHRVVLRLENLEALDMEFWGEDDIPDGFYIAHPSVPSSFKAISRMTEAPDSGYSQEVTIPELNLDNCDYPNLWFYVYVNIGARFGKLGLVNIRQSTQGENQPTTKIYASMNLYVNKELGDRNVATKPGYNFP